MASDSVPLPRSRRIETLNVCIDALNVLAALYTAFTDTRRAA
jgi:hypothetical protein